MAKDNALIYSLLAVIAIVVLFQAGYLEKLGLGSVVSVPTTEWCYQESADVATDCGGLGGGNYSFVANSWSGDYPVSNVFDGLWNTSGRASAGTPAVVVVYAKPTNSVSAEWQVSDGCGVRNLSIPESCFGSVLTLLAQSQHGENGMAVNWKCYTSPDADQMLYSCHDSSIIFEEAMMWGITVERNVTVEDNTTVVNDTSGNTTVEVNLTDDDNESRPYFCPSVCVQLYNFVSNSCVLDACGSGCGANNQTTFDTLSACQARIVAPQNELSSLDKIIDGFKANWFLYSALILVVIIIIALVAKKK